MIRDFPLDFAGFSKTWKPNQCLALPPGFAAKEKPDVTAPVFEAGVDQVHAAWLAMLAAQPRVSGVRRHGGQIEAVQKTPLVGFPDWITAEPVDLGGGRASVCVFSRSKYGIRDMGVNARRVNDWLAALGAQMAKA
jgi:uncharacterized protein (DUF1499 family)